MRSIGWLNIVRDGFVDELLNDLRFLKNASTEGIVTRIMDDAAMCDLYNWQWEACGTATPETPAANEIYELDVSGGFNIADGVTLELYPLGLVSGLFHLDDTAGDIQAVIEAAWGAGNVTVTGSSPFVIELVGARAGQHYLFIEGHEGPVAPSLVSTQEGVPAGGGLSDAFSAIDWDAYNPWSEENDAAAEFLGVWVENWEGLEGEYERTVNQRGWAFGGANFTPLRPKHLSMTYEVILGATTERGLQYGFRWLSNMLYGLDSCDRSELVLFDNCPPAGTAQARWPYWIIRDAGVLDMPRWGETLMETKNCVLRRATFVLGARDPHKYKCPEECTALTEFTVPPPAGDCYTWSEWFCNDSLIGIGCEFNAPGFDITSRTAIVHILAGPGGAPPMQVAVGIDPGGEAVFRTMPLPAGSELVIDSSRHDIRLLTTPGDESTASDGSGYISAGYGTSVAWAELGPLANAALVEVKPLRICGLAGASVMIETVDRV